MDISYPHINNNNNNNNNNKKVILLPLELFIIISAENLLSQNSITYENALSMKFSFILPFCLRTTFGNANF